MINTRILTILMALCTEVQSRNTTILEESGDNRMRSIFRYRGTEIDEIWRNNFK